MSNGYTGSWLDTGAGGVTALQTSTAPPSGGLVQGGPALRMGAYKYIYSATRGWHWAKIRRMNPLNPRALARAHHRCASFERFVLANFRIVHQSRVKPRGKRRRK